MGVPDQPCVLTLTRASYMVRLPEGKAAWDPSFYLGREKIDEMWAKTDRPLLQLLGWGEACGFSCYIITLSPSQIPGL